jgi:hypothetical protein
VRLGARRVDYDRKAHYICYTTRLSRTTPSYAAVVTYPLRAVLLFPSLFMVLFVFYLTGGFPVCTSPVTPVLLFFHCRSR